MAFPTIPTVAAGRVLWALATSPSGTHTSPSLSSLTKNAGDLLIAGVIIYDGNSTNAEFSSWGGGFTEFGDFAGTATMGIGLAYKWSTGSETGTFTVTSADTSTNDSAFFLLSIPGAHASTPPEAGSFATGTGAADPASFNPTNWDVEDTLWIAVAGSGETATTGSYTGLASAPTNFSDYSDSGISADVVGGVEGAVAFRQQAAASQDVAAFTGDTSNARDCAVVIAVRPAPAPVARSATDSKTHSESLTRVGTFLRNALTDAKTFAESLVGGVPRWGTPAVIIRQASVKGYWRLGETSGTTAYDLSGLGHNGTYTGTYTLGAAGALAGDTDKALTLGGSGYVSIADHADYDVANGAWTLMAWVKPSSSVASPGITIASKGTGAWAVKVVSGNLTITRSHQADLVTSGGSVPTGVWTHIGVSYLGSNGQMQTFINGSINNLTSPTSNFVDNNLALEIGRDEDTAQWQGELDEVAFFNTSLGTFPIRAAYLAGASRYGAEVLTDGPTHYYPMQGISTTAYSFSDLQGNSAAYVASPTREAPGPITNDESLNYATILNGTTQAMTVTDHAGLDLGNGPFTLECWVRREVGGATVTFMEKDTNAYRLAVNSADDHLIFLQDDIGYALETGGALGHVGEWVHLVAVWDGTSGGSELYVNGVDQNATFTSRTLADTTSSLTIGSDTGQGSGYLQGGISQVAIYKSALSPERILQHYTAARQSYVVATASGTVDGTTLNISVPSGTQNDDVMYMVVYLTASTGTISTPGGWTAVYSNTEPASSTSSHASLFWRKAASEPGSYNITVTSGRATGAIVTLRGVNTTAPTDVGNSGSSATANLSAVAPAVTPNENELLLTFYGGRLLPNGTGATWTVPTLSKELVDVTTSVASISNSSTAVGWENVLADVTTGSRTGTAATVTSVDWVAYMVAVKKAPEAGGPIIRALVDAITNSEAMARVFTGFRALTDSRTFAESAVRVATNLRATVDSITYAESAARTVAKVRATVDAITTSETATRVFSGFRAATDSRTYAESAVRVYAAVRAATDSETYADVVATVKSLLRQATDSWTYAEAGTRALSAVRTTTDAITDSETVVRVLTALRAATDSETYAEAITALKVRLINIVDSLTSSESLARVATNLRATTDSRTYAESLVRVSSYVRAVVDAITYAESVVASKTGLKVVAIADAITNSETVVRVFTGFRALTDQRTYAESLVRVFSGVRTVTDTRTYAEAVSAFKGRLINISDSITTSESVTRVTTAIRALADSKVFAEAVTRVEAAVRALADSRTHAESVGRSKGAVRSVTGDMTYAEAMARVAALQRAATENRSFAESVVRSVQGAVAQVYYRSAEVLATLTVSVLRRFHLVGGEESPGSVNVPTTMTVGATHVVTRGANYVDGADWNTRTRAAERSGTVPKVE